MAIIKPFRALRPVPEKAKQVACVPYDVVSKSELRSFVDENPLSFLRVTRPRYEFDKNEKPSWEQIFEKAKTNLEWFISEGILKPDGEDAIYIYRLSNSEHSQTGIVACCSLDEYRAGVIKKHENVRPDKVDERTGHILTLRAQTGLIFLAFRGTDTIADLIAEATSEEPQYDFVAPEGIRQQLWRVTDSSPIVSAFRGVPSIYIADGHHRIESAALVRDALQKQNPDHNGSENYNYVMAGLFPTEELRILPYNRIVKDLNGLTVEEFITKLGESFVVTESGEKVPKGHGEMCLYIDGRWLGLRFNVNYVRQPDLLDRLDVSILQDFVLRPILAIVDPRTDDRLAFVGGNRGTTELERAVNEGEAVAAFSMFATTMDDLLDVSDAGEIMPPKSTWFEPKLKDGLLVHLI